jgi:serralysin
MTATTTSGTTNGDNDIDGVSSGFRWAVSSMTYSFPTSSAQYEGQSDAVGFSAFRSDQADAVRLMAADINSFCGLTLTEETVAPEIATFRFGRTSTPFAAGAYSYGVSSGVSGGDCWVEKDGTYDGVAAIGNKFFQALQHEFGHAVGLKHPHVATPAVLSTLKDAIENTVMSYREFIGDTVDNWANVGAGSFPQTMMMLDIKCLQFFYGKNTATRTGNTLYTINASTGEMSVNGTPDGRIPTANKVFRTIWDATGDNDQVLGAALAPGAWVSTATGAQLPDLGGGHTPPGMIANALDADSTIEGTAAPPAATGRIRLLGLRI